MIDTWIGILTKPEETMAAEKANANIVGGLINVVIASVIVAIIAGVIMAIITAISSLIPGLGNIAGALGVIAIIVVPIGIVITCVIGSLLLNLFFWGAAKILGGNGSFGTQYYLLSLIAVPMVVISIVAMIIGVVLAIIPFIGIIIGMLLMYLISGYISIILMAAYIAAIKEAHGFATMNVALTTGIGYVITLIVMMVLGLIFAASVFTALGGASMMDPSTMFAGLV